MLSDQHIEAIIRAEEEQAIGFSGEGSQIQSNRKVLLDYYNQKPYGDEIDGQSKTVTSDVADHVNAMQPELVRRFTQQKYIAKFTCDDEEEEKQKTEYANYVFCEENDPVDILGDMFFDGNLQYNGIVKVTWDESVNKSEKNYTNLSELDLLRAQQVPNLEIVDIDQDEETGLYNVKAEKVISNGRHRIENIPPDEYIFARRSRCFKTSPFQGQRTPKTRSDLIEMGFDKALVMSLPVEGDEVDNQVKNARNKDLESPFDENPSSDPANDLIYLGEYYIKMDVDEDGIAELWQVFFAANRLLEKTRVDDNPYCVHVPIPMPHKAIGTCIAEQVADKQYWKSTMVRHANNNVYATNFNRMAANERVNLDDLLTPRHGGVTRIDGQGPVQDSLMMIPVQNQVPAVIEMINYIDSAMEKQTGITSYNQGVDTESLNKTATGFRGIRDMAQMRLELVSRIAANGAIKRIFEKIIELAKIHVEDTVKIKDGKNNYEVTPSQWDHEHKCKVDIGLGSGDRQEKIANLGLLYQEQKELKINGSPLVDDQKMYNTLDKISSEVGLKSAASYFNDPSQPDDLLRAENEQLRVIVNQMQQQMQATMPLMQAEQIKADAKLQETMIKEENKAEIELAKMQQQERMHDDDVAVELTKIEAQNNVNVPGAVI